MLFHMDFRANVFITKYCTGMVSLQCVFLNADKVLLRNENILLHNLHRYGFSPVWIIVWSSRVHFCANTLSHKLQRYGFSPVWILLCSWDKLSVQKLFCINCTYTAFLQCVFFHVVPEIISVQMLSHINYNGMVFLQYEVCCFVEIRFLCKCFLHKLHLYGFSPVCVLECWRR